MMPLLCCLVLVTDGMSQVGVQKEDLQDFIPVYTIQFSEPVEATSNPIIPIYGLIMGEVVQLTEEPHTSLPTPAYKAFFCKMEWEFEKRHNLPVRFRLGDYERVEELEGKGWQVRGY